MTILILNLVLMFVFISNLSVHLSEIIMATFKERKYEKVVISDTLNISTPNIIMLKSVDKTS